MKKSIRYFWDSMTSRAYWQYIFMSRHGASSIFAIFGAIYLVVEALDFFSIFTRDRYGSFAFLVFLFISVLISIFIRRPIKSISISIPQKDIVVEVCVADIFEVNGAIMISTNSVFEADVAGGKIAPESLQGQFTARYFTGNQVELIENLNKEIEKLDTNAPHPMGTVIPVSTHGKVFYFTVMADLNEHGTASTTPSKVRESLEGLWNYVRESGELQSLVLPVIGTGRGRLKTSRKQMINIIADSFSKASGVNKFSERLIIVIRPEDAKSFAVNLYDIKDSLRHMLT